MKYRKYSSWSNKSNERSGISVVARVRNLFSRRGVGYKSAQSSRGKTRSIKKWLVGAGVLLVFWMIFFSPLFSVRDISVIGASVVGEEAIKERAAEGMVGRRWLVFPRESIFFYDTASLRNAIQESDTRIASAVITKHFPPALVVTIQEQTQVAVWQMNNRYFALNADGVATTEVVGDQSKNLLLTSSARVEDVILGQWVVSKKVLDEVGAMYEALKKVDGITIESYDVAEESLFTIKARTGGGWSVYLSTHLALDDQMQKLRAFIAEKARQNKDWQKDLSYVDLRFGSTKIYYQ